MQQSGEIGGRLRFGGIGQTRIANLCPPPPSNFLETNLRKAVRRAALRHTEGMQRGEGMTNAPARGIRNCVVSNLHHFNLVAQTCPHYILFKIKEKLLLFNSVIQHCAIRKIFGKQVLVLIHTHQYSFSLKLWRNTYSDSIWDFHIL